MHVLSIGSDRKLFDKESAVSARMIEYGKKIGSLHVVVFTYASQGFTKTVLSNEVTIYPTQSHSRIGCVFDAIRIGKGIVKDQKFVRGDAGVTCQDPFEAGFVGWRIASYFRLPFHLQVHTDFLSPYFNTSFIQKIRIILARFLLPKASGVRVVSKRILTSLEKAHIKLSCDPQILPIRISVPVVESRQGKENLFPEFTFVTVMASRLEKEKRIEDALRAHQSVVSMYPRAGLVIAGDGSRMAFLRKYAHELGIADSVRFLGWNDDVLKIIASGDIFLSTSEYEGYGMSMIEAGLLGVPVVTTDVGIAGDVLVDKKNARVCPVGDVPCITRAISDLLTHNSKRHELALALQHDIKHNIPTAEQYTDAYVQGLRDILLKSK